MYSRREGSADSNESAVIRILDHDMQPSEQAVSIGLAVSPMPLNGSLCPAEVPSISQVEESPLARAAAVQGINRAIILGPLLHGRPVRSAELSHQCLREGRSANCIVFVNFLPFSVPPSLHTQIHQMICHKYKSSGPVE